MFNLFSKKPAYKITDLIWISGHAKMEGCISELQNKKYDHIVAWFPDTQRTFEAYFRERGVNARIQRTGELQLRDMQDKHILMLEHYPLLRAETELFNGWTGAEISILSSLDEAWLSQFGAESIRGLMKKLGMREHEVLSHPMITSSIQNAQKKLDKKITSELKADSMEEWFRLNGGA